MPAKPIEQELPKKHKNTNEHLKSYEYTWTNLEVFPSLLRSKLHHLVHSLQRHSNEFAFHGKAAILSIVYLVYVYEYISIHFVLSMWNKNLDIIALIDLMLECIFLCFKFFFWVCLIRTSPVKKVKTRCKSANPWSQRRSGALDLHFLEGFLPW